MTTLVRTELKLFLREPVTVLIGVLLPAVLLAGLGSIPALRVPTDVFGGLSFIDYFAPSLLAISIAVLGLQTLPVGLATYREKGVLRRLAATPTSPASVLVAQLAITVATAALGTIVMVAVAVLAFDVPAPRHPLGFLAAFVLGTAAVFAVGLAVAAFAPRARVAAGIGTVLFMLCQFFSGVYLPKFLLPEAIVAISVYVPPGIAAFQDAWTGAGPQPAQLAVMAAIAVAATVAAARFFRWE